MGLDFSKLEIYPLPGAVANSVWGCFLELKNGVASIDLGRNECCQQMTKNLFIAEKSTLHPKVTDEEIAKLFPEQNGGSIKIFI